MFITKTIMTILLSVAAVSAATPERLKEQLVRALPLAEASQVAEAMQIVHEAGGCDTAPDRQEFEPVPYVGSEAEGIQKAIELIDRGRYALADGLVRAMTGCYSGILDAVMRNHEEKTLKADSRVIEVSDDDECQENFEFCNDLIDDQYGDDLWECGPSYSLCTPEYLRYLEAYYQTRRNQCATHYYHCWLACCS